MKNIVLVVGHTSSRKGARNFKGESEYFFNKRIALKVSEKLDHKITVLYKDKFSLYEKNLKELKPYLAIELHFNSFDGHAQGCEALSVETSPEAIAFLYLLSKKFKLRNRGVKTLQETSRGYGNLMVLRRHCTKSFILEPCFQKETKIFNNEDKYALLIAQFLQDYLPNKTKTIKQEESLWRKLFQFLWGLLRS